MIEMGLARRFTRWTCVLVVTACSHSAHAKLLVSNFGTGEVLEYDDATGDFVGVFASGNGLTNPAGLAIGPDGNLYVSNFGSGVWRFDGATGSFLDVFTTAIPFAIGLTFGPDDNLYVANQATSLTGAVHRFDGDTGDFIDVFADHNGFSSTGITFDPSGTLFVADANPTSEDVLVFDGSTGALLTDLNGESQPFGLVIGPDENLYVTHATKRAVDRYDPVTRTFIDEFASGGGLMSPMGIAFGPGGDLYVASSDPDTPGILRYDGTTGDFIEVFASGPELDSPSFLIFIDSGSLVGDADGDGDVDGDDLIAVQANFGSTSPPPGDADGDGDVDGDDLIAVQANFGATASETLSVPEPTHLVLVLSLLALGVGCRPRSR